MVCAGFFTSVHGIKGGMKAEIYLQNRFNFSSLMIFINNEGKKVESCFYKSSSIAVLSIDSVNSCELAESLVKKKFYIKKSSLPELKVDEFYYQDLIGFNVFKSNQELYGKVLNIHNFGSCDIFEIKLHNSNETEMLPFVREYFSEIDTEKQAIYCVQKEI